MFTIKVNKSILFNRRTYMKLKYSKKTGLKKFTIEDIRSSNPCYDPSKYLKENFKGSAIDILNNEYIPFEDRLWVILRTEIVSEKLMRLFAVWSYRQTLVFVKNPDPRSIKAADISEAFALDKASREELSAARSAALSAAESAAWSAARSAAWSAAKSAARSAQKEKLIEMILIEAGERIKKYEY